MTISDRDTDHRLRDNTTTLSAVGFVAALVIIGLVLLYMFVPRPGEPITANPTKAPVTSTSPTPATTPTRP